MNDEAAVRALVENWAAAVRAKDFDGILRHHSPDMLMFDVPPPFQSRGLAAYRKTWDVFFASAHDPIVFDILDMTIASGGDVAFVAAVMRCLPRERDGTDTDLEFRLTVGLRKIGGEWTVMHEHHSVPATD
jgi:uncharacterized protein (TIGR02246 family)